MQNFGSILEVFSLTLPFLSGDDRNEGVLLGLFFSSIVHTNVLFCEFCSDVSVSYVCVWRRGCLGDDDEERITCISTSSILKMTGSWAPPPTSIRRETSLGDR